MQTPTPHTVRLRAELTAGELKADVGAVLEQARAAGLPEPTRFESPVAKAARPFAVFDPARIVDQRVAFILADETYLMLSRAPGAPATVVQAVRSGEPLTEAEVREAQHRQAGLLRGLLAGGRLRAGSVERIEPNVSALPSVPLAARYPALVADDAQAERAYADPAPFWAAWDEDQAEGGQHLLTRHLDAAATPDWFRAVFDAQWAMARAARPGETFYGRRIAPAGCEELLTRGESCLRQVGYRDGEVELAGFVPPGQHVPPWEILAWNEVLGDGRLADGSPVAAVRVVFRNEEMARREATPLLDIGAQVAYLGRDGLYHPVA
jgi:hypothetical protein